MCGKGSPWSEKLESCENMEDATFKTTELNDHPQREHRDKKQKPRTETCYSPRSRRQKTRGTSKGDKAATGAEASNSGVTMTMVSKPIFLNI